jgi:hypothetical protein
VVRNYETIFRVRPFQQPQTVAVEAPVETLGQHRARLKTKWREAETDFDAAFRALADHDAKRHRFDVALTQAAERRNRLLAEIAALRQEASRG